MLLKGWVFRAGSIGAIIFLLAIAPLGVGAAFPCTVIVAISTWLLLRNKQIDYLWISKYRKIAALSSKQSELIKK
jgi:Domain of unknown function (DUF4342)